LQGAQNQQIIVHAQRQIGDAAQVVKQQRYLPHQSTNRQRLRHHFPVHRRGQQQAQRFVHPGGIFPAKQSGGQGRQKQPVFIGPRRKTRLFKQAKKTRGAEYQVGLHRLLERIRVDHCGLRLETGD